MQHLPKQDVINCVETYPLLRCFGRARYPPIVSASEDHDFCRDNHQRKLFGEWWRGDLGICDIASFNHGGWSSNCSVDFPKVRQSNMPYGWIPAHHQADAPISASGQGWRCARLSGESGRSVDPRCKFHQNILCLRCWKSSRPNDVWRLHRMWNSLPGRAFS